MDILLFGVMVLLYTFQSLFCRLYTEARNGSGTLQFTVVYATVAGVCTFAVNGFSYHPSWITLLLGLGNALVLLTYNVSMVKCGNIGSYAFMMICMLSGGILMPMVYDAFYLNVSFNWMQLSAVALMLISFVLMNLDGMKGQKSGKYLALCTLLFVVNGIYSILMNLQQNLMAFTQRNEMIITTYFGMGVITTTFEMIFARKDFLNGFKMNKKALISMFVSAVSAMIAVNLLMYVMQKVNLTVLAVINNGGVLVFSAIFAFTLFKEKLTLPKTIGVAISCVSIVMLSI